MYQRYSALFRVSGLIAQRCRAAALEASTSYGASTSASSLPAGLRSAAGSFAHQAHLGNAPFRQLHAGHIHALRTGLLMLRGRLHEAVQLQKSKVQEVREKVLRWEHRVATIVNSVSISSAGQQVLAASVPVAVATQLFPGRFRCLAYEIRAMPFHRSVLPPKKPLLNLRMPEFFTSLVEEVAIWMRGLYLALLFAPSVVSSFIVFGFGVYRPQWMSLLRWTLMNAGPAFIKWGQWASTRPDLFPQDMCAVLEQLQTSAPSHSGAYSKQAISAAFERPVQHLFDAFEEEPVASGSIAQIHRARLSAIGASYTGYKQGTTVAVKVRHPGVTVLMERDFVLMERAARMASQLPGLAELRLDESIRQFGGPLKEQLDLSVEATHLSRFQHNFRTWSNVSFPTPIYPLVAPDVLVESFEDGNLISTYVKTPGARYNENIAETGMLLYLQMLLKDNFIHADLHPGNILVREVNQHLDKTHSFLRLLSRWFEFSPRLILLDTGMIAELNRDDRTNLIEFFRALTQQDGEHIARTILDLSESHTCKNPEAFVEDLRDMFDSLDPAYIQKYTSQVFKDMIETLRKHSVTLKSTVSTVVVTTLVLEGWSQQLNPDLHILDTMRDMLSVKWADRISLTVDKIMSSGSVAVV